MSLSLLSLTVLSCKSLLGNPLRSGLSVIGVFMGVAAVSATLQVGKISQAVITQQLAERDAPQVQIYADRHPVTRQRAQLTLKDIEFLQQQLDQVQAISGMNWIRQQPQVLFQDQTANPFAMAVAPNFLLTTGKTLIQGRDFSTADYEQYRPVVIIDRYLAETLFQGKNAVGQIIYLNLRPYAVLGILPTDPAATEPQGELFIPTAIHSTTTGKREMNILILRPYRLEDLESVQEKTIALLEQRFPGYSFWAWNTVEDILTQQKTLESVSKALLVVGAIALLVGGVGIANITIASVIERT
ncbi:MAG: ABC transporter permease, partial [Microcoleaceae cyanobacterium]